MIDKEVEDNFQKFWADLILDPTGSVNLEQVKKELYDYSMILREVSIVYDSLTGGRISKPNTLAFEVISVADERVEDLIREVIIEELESQ